MRWLYRGIPCTLALHPFLLFASTPVLPQPKGASSTTAHSHCPCVCLTWSIYELSGAFMLLCEMHMNPRGMGWLLFFSFSFVPSSQITQTRPRIELIIFRKSCWNVLEEQQKPFLCCGLGSVWPKQN